MAEKVSEETFFDFCKFFMFFFDFLLFTQINERLNGFSRINLKQVDTLSDPMNKLSL